ncbi:MAG: LytR/AlgR family response regulator transcription factor [Chitinophagales bacterium]
MKVLIVEDEKLSSDLLIRLLNKIDPSIMVVKVLDSVKKSIEVISNGLKADLLFLDIHLSDGNSFEILEKTNLQIPIIFTTAYNDYAIKAFKHNSIDYLLKPIGSEDLAIAIEKFKKFNHPQISDFSQHYKMLLGQLSSNFKTRFMVKSGLSISTI